MAYPYWPTNYWPSANAFYWPIRHYRYWPGGDGDQVTMGGTLSLAGGLRPVATGADDSDSKEVAVVKRIGIVRPARVSYPK